MRTDVCLSGRMRRCRRLLRLATLWLIVLAVAGAFQLTAATTWCVNQQPSTCPYLTIGAAVTAASAGDTVQVQPGVYFEAVTITKPLYLVAPLGGVVINAIGANNAISISGTATAPLKGVVVSGFTIQGANYEGILVNNASGVTVSNNLVMANNRSLNTTNLAAVTCPGLPAFEANENSNCGAAIHLIAVDHSVVAKNVVTNNAGGILVTDENGAAFNNLIVGNNINNNPYDAGITLASYLPNAASTLTAPAGVFHNSVTGNTVMTNGTTVPGAGVNLNATGSAGQVYCNVVANNTISGNGLPGVILHSLAQPVTGQTVNMNDNAILSNQIAGNAADTGAAATAGMTGVSIYSLSPVTGTVISQNSLVNEQVDVVVNIPSGDVAVTLNDLYAPTGVSNTGNATINANMNYWGCSSGPGQSGCGTSLGTVLSPTFAATAY